jgi:DNA modification methylase
MLMTYAPHKHLPRILDDLGGHLSWWWCYAVVHDGAWGKVRDRWVQCGWKPVLGFVKDGGHPAHRLPNDVQLLRRKEKTDHRWQQAQAEAEYWIEAYTEPGDLIVDPFAGSGTTLAAAKELGRRAIGCDIDPAAYVTAVERVS